MIMTKTMRKGAKRRMMMMMTMMAITARTKAEAKAKATKKARHNANKGYSTKLWNRSSWST